MHIALVHDHVGGKAGGGGGVRLMLELGLGLVRRGHRVTVVCHDHADDGAFDDLSGQLEIRSVRRGVATPPTTNAALARRYFVDLPKIARLVPHDADIINAHEWPALRPGRIAAGRLATPLVWTRNDESLWERAIVPEQTIYGDLRMSRRLLRAAVCWPDLLDARRASAIVVLSAPQVQMVRRSYRRGAVVAGIGPADRFFAPPDRAAARARLGIPDDVFLVVGSGILVEHRRFEVLIEAMALLRDEHSIHALVAGSDHVDPNYADRMAALIAHHGLQQRVRLPRQSVSDAAIQDTYAAADAFAILSQRYAWGLAPLEALAGGTPVILTEGAGVVDILAGRPGVQVVPREDPGSLADAIRGWRSGCGRAGIEQTRAWLQEEYSIDRYVERMEAVYASAAGKATAHRRRPRPWFAQLVPRPERERGVEGPHAQFGEDRILEQIFEGRSGGWCAEVGAFDGLTGSATLLFERKGWNCLLVEPTAELVDQIRRNRSCVVEHCAASSQEGTATFFVAQSAEQMSTLESDRGHHRWIREVGGSVRETTVRTARLDDLLDAAGFPELQFLTIDVEGHELDVLQGLSLERFTPRVVIVEQNLLHGGSSVVDHMAAHGYVNFKRTGVNDWYAHEGDAELVQPEALTRFRRARQIERVQERWFATRDACMRFGGRVLPDPIKQRLLGTAARLSGRR